MNYVLVDMIEQSVIDLVTSRLTISKVLQTFNIQYYKSGLGCNCLCPYHDEKTPSMHFKTLGVTFHCFGCGKSGNALQLVQHLQGCDFVTAVKIGADITGVFIDWGNANVANIKSYTQAKKIEPPQEEPLTEWGEVWHKPQAIDSTTFNNILVELLRHTFGDEVVLSVLQKYGVYAINATDIVFPYVDNAYMLRYAKTMRYTANGKRDKRFAIKQNPTAAELEPRKLCKRSTLFGEHLNISKAHNTPVYVVESEKTALIMACAYPQYIWLATGGGTQTKALDRFIYDYECSITLIPDVDKYTDYADTYDPRRLTLYRNKVRVAKSLYLCATDEEGGTAQALADTVNDYYGAGEQDVTKIDIADVVLAVMQAEGQTIGGEFCKAFLK